MKCANCGAYVAPQDTNCLSCGALLENGQTVGAQPPPQQPHAAPPPSPYGAMQPAPPPPGQQPAGSYPTPPPAYPQPPAPPAPGTPQPTVPPPLGYPPPPAGHYGAPPPQQPYPPGYTPYPQSAKPAPLVLGIIGVVFALIFPLVTYACSIPGLVMAVSARKTGVYRTADLVLNIVALGVAVINSFAGCMMRATLYSWLF